MGALTVRHSFTLETDLLTQITRHWNMFIIYRHRTYIPLPGPTCRDGPLLAAGHEQFFSQPRWVFSQGEQQLGGKRPTTWPVLGSPLQLLPVYQDPRLEKHHPPSCVGVPTYLHRFARHFLHCTDLICPATHLMTPSTYHPHFGSLPKLQVLLVNNQFPSPTIRFTLGVSVEQAS